jgi:pyrroline-5-carboxylate reductase
MKSFGRVVSKNATCMMPHRYISNKVQSSIKLCVLGGGNMAEAIISALSKCETQNMNDIVVYDVNESRIKHLKGTYGVTICKNVEEGIKDADVTLLSVKPQNVESLVSSISSPPKGLILSIVAGCTIDRLKEVFKTNKIVRSMPNTPAMVLEAMTVWVATKDTPQEDVERAKFLLTAIGDQVEVNDENLIDMATAVSGSGPAYVFLTMEAMIDAAVHIGFPR